MAPVCGLTCLRAAEKDGLIGELWARVGALTGMVAERQGRLAKSGRGSDKPPFADGLNKPGPTSLRRVGEMPT